MIIRNRIIPLIALLAVILFIYLFFLYKDYNNKNLYGAMAEMDVIHNKTELIGKSFFSYEDIKKMSYSNRLENLTKYKLIKIQKVDDKYLGEVDSFLFEPETGENDLITEYISFDSKFIECDKVNLEYKQRGTIFFKLNEELYINIKKVEPGRSFDYYLEVEYTMKDGSNPTIDILNEISLELMNGDNQLEISCDLDNSYKQRSGNVAYYKIRNDNYTFSDFQGNVYIPLALVVDSNDKFNIGPLRLRNKNISLEPIKRDLNYVQISFGESAYHNTLYINE